MRSLDRLIAILEAVAAGAGSTTPVQVSRQTRLPLPTVSRLIRELAEQRYLHLDGTSNACSLGSRLLELSYAARPTNLFNSLVPEMERLRDITGETVSLHVRSGEQRVCVCEIQSTLSVRRVVPVGLILPLHFGATGIVLLTGASEAFVRTYLAKLGIAPADEQALCREIAATRERGWAMAEDSWIAGLAGLAAPIRDASGVVASLVASGPTFRWNRQTMLPHVDAVLGAARRASSSLSGRPPDPIAAAARPAIRARRATLRPR